MIRRSAVFTTLLLIMGLGATAGCQSAGSMEPIRTAEYVNLERFMGDWYVLAAIPTRLERSAFNAVESYSLEDDGTVATTFAFNEGGFDGKRRVYEPKGFVRDRTSNAVWGMQFIWPFKADYRVVYVDADYTYTIIGRTKRDYVWIMARTPSVDAETYNGLVAMVAAEGYDIDQLREVPQRW